MVGLGDAMKLRKVVENRTKDGRLVSYKVDCHLQGIKPQWETFTIAQKADAEARVHAINGELFTRKGRSLVSEAEQRTPVKAVQERIFEALTNEHSRAAYQQVVNRLNEQGVQFIDDITADTVRTILNNGNYRKKSAVKFILFTDLLVRRAKTFFNSRIHPKYRRINLKDGAELIKMEKPKKKGYLSEDQINAILEAFKEKKYSDNAFFFATLAKWGFRVSELINLRWKDISKVQGRWMVTVAGKGGHEQQGVQKERSFEIGLAFKDKLWAHSCYLYQKRLGRDPVMDSEDYIFLNTRPLRMKESDITYPEYLTYSGIVKQWKKVLTDLKIDYKSHTIHSLRRFACYWIYRHTKDVLYTKSVCGWSQQAINYYLNPVQEAGKSALDAIGSSF
jgi:integrase